MSKHDLEQLIGGFAADTLTPEERQALFTAALQDQTLFNALADEQALKELLADPLVRRKLLQALEQTRNAGGVKLSWLDWLRRPVGLGFTGGLAAAVLAVVLGTKIYQNSLQEAAQSVATEEPSPATQSIPAPPPSDPSFPETDQKTKGKTAAPPDLAKNDAPTDHLTGRDKLSKPQAAGKRRAPDRADENATPLSEKDESLRQEEAPGALRSNAGEKTGALTDKNDQALRSAPATPAPEPKQTPSAATAPFAGVAAPGTGARARFYAGEPSRGERRTMAKEEGPKSLAEEHRQTNPRERKLEKFADRSSTEPATAKPVNPLGLRYSFVVREADRQDREVDAITASKSGGQARLTVEANQDGYVQILMAVGASAPQALFPAEETGQSSIKIVAGNRYDVPLTTATDGERITLIVRLSREPLKPVRGQEAAGRLSSNLLVELVTPGGPTGAQEQAVYVTNQDPSPTAEIVVEIPVGR
ncbi:MAG: hypothetical protein ACT4OO_02040 [Nitrospiraceae bacterium]